MPDEPRYLTPDQMILRAEVLEASAKQKLAEAQGDLDKAERLRRTAASLGWSQKNPAETSSVPSPRLTSDADSTILPGVNANSSAKLARGMSRSRSKKHPFVRALYEHPDPKKRMTVTDWAKKHGYKPGTVATWVAKPGADGSRRIPREAADLIEKELGLPADSTTWKNGI